MSFTCEFCDKVLTTKKILTIHQENAKYCLKIRGAGPKHIFKCDLCIKTFSHEHHLKAHLKICKQTKIVTCDEDYKQKYTLQQKELTDAKKLLKEYNKIISERD